MKTGCSVNDQSGDDAIMLEMSHVMCTCLIDSWCEAGHLHWLRKPAQLLIGEGVVENNCRRNHREEAIYCKITFTGSFRNCCFVVLQV